MIAKVITLSENFDSFSAATRCIESAQNHGLTVFTHEATTPKEAPAYFEENGISDEFFDDHYSFKDKAMACFASHHRLWMESWKTKKNILILEHDAVFVSPVPDESSFEETFSIVNLAKPSFGKFITPKGPYEGMIVSRRTYIGGAHGYVISPLGAVRLISNSKERALPADQMIDIQDRYLIVKEIYPWCIKAEDSFSTVQRKEGCLAKHRYNNDYKII